MINDIIHIIQVSIEGFEYKISYFKYDLHLDQLSIFVRLHVNLVL